MTTLTKLAAARDQILRAELAALLHNVGKLDANFLAQKTRKADQAKAEEDVKARGFFIPAVHPFKYQFQRFAAPDPELFQPAVGQVLEDDVWRAKGRIAFGQELANRVTWKETEQQAIPALLADWNKAKDTHPILARSFTAAWQLYVFTWANGPLYYPQADQLAPNLSEQAQLAPEVKRLAERINAAPSKEQREKLGREQGPLKKRLEALEKAEASLRQIEREAQKQREDQFRQITLTLADEQWSLADLLTLFWDHFFYQPSREDPEQGYKRQSALLPWLLPKRNTLLPALLILAHGEVSGLEKDSGEAEEPGVGEEGAGQDAVEETEDQNLLRQGWPGIYESTAFGYEPRTVDQWQLLATRQALIETTLAAATAPRQERAHFIAQAKPALEQALGDTRWPINEINLWDFSATIAALFKSSAAKASLGGRLPTVGEMRWSLLHLSFDGLDFWGQAHHVTDLLGRREVLTRGLDNARELLEVTYPLGNEIYRDEHGAVFVVPDTPDLLNLTDDQSQTLQQLLAAAFNAAGLADELVPHVDASGPYRGKKLNLAGVLKDRRRTNRPDPEAAGKWWTGGRPDNAEICTVCGLRPVGYPQRGSPAEAVLELAPWADPAKARDRNVCRICLDRRGRRARDWAKDENGLFGQTVWTDEVADQHGRLALVVGRFDLTGWLDGRLIPTMQKEVSFARIRRCWETTRAFWQEVQAEILPGVMTPVPGRLKITVKDPAAVGKALGAYHVYDWPLPRGVTLSVVWDPEQRAFLSADNPLYLTGPEQLGRLEKPEQDPLRALRELTNAIRARPRAGLREPSGYGRPSETKVTVEVEDVALLDDSGYRPFIPLAAEPALFMALVPAAQGLKVAEAIRDKYQAEMGRVRDRLPLHLGLVFFPRRTPLRAVLEAGRSLLAMGGDWAWEPWTVVAADPPQPWDPTNKTAPTSHRTLTFANGAAWTVPLRMGDGHTPDRWYPHLLIEKPPQKEPLPDNTCRHAAALQGVDPTNGRTGSQVWVRPSRFDFIFLDATGRRFELHYGPDGRRPARPTRPYLLEDLARFRELWTDFATLQRAQINQVIGAIEETRRAWAAGYPRQEAEAPVFWRFVADTLAGANWPKDRRWRTWAETQRQALIAAAAAGELADLVELHLHILKDKKEASNRG